MKIKLLITAAIVAALSLSSCDGKDAKLAGELVGTWKGAPTTMMNGKKDKPDKDHKSKDGNHDNADRAHGGEMTCTPTLTFVRTDGTNGGTINLSADYVVAQGVESATATTPVKATVKGTVKAAGSWTVKDGDEIKIIIDPSKTVVDVDTTSIALSYSRLTDAPQDSLSSMKSRVATNLEGIVKPMLMGRIQKMHSFDDVKIVGNAMTLEAGHNKMSFTKQP